MMPSLRLLVLALASASLSLAARLACPSFCPQCNSRSADEALSFLSHVMTQCARASHYGCDGSTAHCAQVLFPRERSYEISLNLLLEHIGHAYHPKPSDKCVLSQDLLTKGASNESYVQQAQQLAQTLLEHLAQGLCILPHEAIDDFREDLFYHYGDRCAKIITKTGFERLLNDLKSPAELKKVESLPATDGCLKPPERLRRAAAPSPIHVHFNLANECFSPDDLLERFGQFGRNLSWTEFVQLCPALVQQVVSGVCEPPLLKTVPSPELTIFELYGYSSLAILMISLCSLVGVLIIPFVTKSAYSYVMVVLIGLAFGTMSGDAILHLIPQILGLHKHSDHDEDDHEEIPEYLFKQLGLLGISYLLFLMQITVDLFKKKEGKSHGHIHSHSHIPDQIQLRAFSSNTESTYNLNSNSVLELASSTPDLKKPPTPMLPAEPACLGLTSLAWMIILGDGLHNLADGLAVGAAFTSGLRGGLATSLAVLAHELPHEFGDFAILVSTGLSYKKALALNFLSSLTSFAGLYAGLTLSEDAEVRSWVLVFTAAMFLYVAFVEMIPELKQPKEKEGFKMWIAKNLGVLLGFGIMIVIALYEDKIQI